MHYCQLPLECVVTIILKAKRGLDAAATSLEVGSGSVSCYGGWVGGSSQFPL